MKKKCLNLSIILSLLAIQGVMASTETLTTVIEKTNRQDCNGVILNFKYQADIKFQIVDFSYKKVLDTRMIPSDLALTMKNKFSASSSMAKLMPIMLPYDPITKKMVSRPKFYCFTYNTTFNYTFNHLNSWSSLSSSDHILLAPEKLGEAHSYYINKEISVAGYASKQGRFLSVKAGLLSNAYAASSSTKRALESLVMHEEGHRLGLDHTSDPQADNLMSYKNPPSFRLNDQQIEDIALAAIIGNGKFTLMKNKIVNDRSDTFTLVQSFNFKAGESAHDEAKSFLGDTFSGAEYYDNI
jgi:hypothetical protein